MIWWIFALFIESIVIVALIVLIVVVNDQYCTLHAKYRKAKGDAEALRRYRRGETVGSSK